MWENDWFGSCDERFCISWLRSKWQIYQWFSRYRSCITEDEINYTYTYSMYVIMICRSTMNDLPISPNKLSQGTTLLGLSQKEIPQRAKGKQGVVSYGIRPTCLPQHSSLVQQHIKPPSTTSRTGCPCGTQKQKYDLSKGGRSKYWTCTASIARQSAPQKSSPHRPKQGLKAMFVSNECSRRKR